MLHEAVASVTSQKQKKASFLAGNFSLKPSLGHRLLPSGSTVPPPRNINRNISRNLSEIKKPLPPFQTVTEDNLQQNNVSRHLYKVLWVLIKVLIKILTQNHLFKDRGNAFHSPFKLQLYRAKNFYNEKRLSPPDPPGSNEVALFHALDSTWTVDQLVVSPQLRGSNPYPYSSLTYRNG